MFCSSQRRARCALALEVVVASTLLLVHQELLAAPSDPQDLSVQCKLESLPDDIRGTLTRRFGEWRVQEPTDLSGSAHARWAAESPPACPGIATGRFQNEKDTAYALLLIPTDRSDSEFSVVVFTQQPKAKGIYGYKLVEHGEAGASDTFLLSTTASKYLQVDSIWKSRSRPQDSLLLVSVGAKKEAYVYYWVNDSYQRQAVSFLV
jgi:hypothetical protein